MSTETRELSTYDAHPILLFTFQRNITRWRYTGADEDKIVNTELYESYAIDAPPFEGSDDTSKSSINLDVVATLPFLDQYRSGAPSEVITLTINKYHEGESEIETPWVGRVVNVVFQENTAKIRCEPVSTSMRRPVLPRRYQANCPYDLYNPKTCKVDKEAFKVIATVASVTGTTINSPQFDALPDGYFIGGYIEWSIGSNIERRNIIAHVGANITVSLPFTGIAATVQVNAFPGCAHTMSVCNSKFNNVDNYGGQPFFGNKNPMTGTPIY